MRETTHSGGNLRGIKLRLIFTTRAYHISIAARKLLAYADHQLLLIQNDLQQVASITVVQSIPMQC